MSKGDKKIPVAAIYMNIGNGNEIFRFLLFFNLGGFMQKKL